MSTLKNGIKKITFFVSTFLDCYKDYGKADKNPIKRVGKTDKK